MGEEADTSMSKQPSIATRAWRRLRRYGPRGSLARAASLAWRYVHLRDRHIWLELPLNGTRARRQLPEGVALRRGGREDLPALEQLPTLGYRAARRRLRSGAALWLAAEGDQSAFACWIFAGRTPVFAARHGWVELPPGAVSLEDSVTSPAFRGRSVAPGAWSEIADILASSGARTLLTTVEEKNTAVRRALEKVGFQEIAVVDQHRVGPRVRVRAEASAGSSTGSFLAERLRR
jgi:ribosomal protein S18 acetylase RimI-like enzyme